MEVVSTNDLVTDVLSVAGRDCYDGLISQTDIVLQDKDLTSVMYKFRYIYFFTETQTYAFLFN